MPASLSYILFSALVLALLALLAVCLRRSGRIAAANRRFCLTMSNAYEQVCELDLTHNEFYQYFILNGLFEKAKRHEPLDVYLPRLIRERVYPKDTEPFHRLLSMENLVRLSEQNRSFYIEYRRLSPKGTPYWCSMLAQGLARGPRQPSVVMLYITDIDETKSKEHKAHVRLTQALKNAEHLSEVKSNFTSRVSHEIRTPLNAIMGYIAIAREHAAEPERVADCLGKADLASRHLLSIVNDILDISALESGKVRLDERPFKLRDFIANLTSIFDGQAREAGLSFAVRLEGITEENLLGDDIRLRQILMNLISNALKFTPQGGHVEVRISQQAVVNDVVHLAFSVADDGIGMRESFLDHLFDAYEQEEEATARTYGGSGLGLSIVKNLVEMMGGRITVKSVYGEGSTFEVSLPVRCVRYELPQGAQRRAVARLRVLAVSDDRSTLELVAELLNGLGISFDTAISGYVAVEKAKRAAQQGRGYDLMLLDWDADGPDGAETCGQVRAALGDGLSIAAIADRNVTALRAKAESLRVARIVQKPLNASILLDILCELARPDAEEPKQPPRPPDLSGNRVLLVEDNRLNREIGRELLQSLRLEVDAAENGEECLSRFFGQPEGTYQLILMDLQMPVMDGFTATRRIRSSGRGDAQSIPIVALTANAHPSDVNQSLAAGMNAHASKPIDPEALCALLAQYISHENQEGD